MHVCSHSSSGTSGLQRPCTEPHLEGKMKTAFPCSQHLAHFKTHRLSLQTDKGKSRSSTPSGSDGLKRPAAAAANKRKADAQPADASKRVTFPSTSPVLLFEYGLV